MSEEKSDNFGLKDSAQLPYNSPYIFYLDFIS